MRDKITTIIFFLGFALLAGCSGKVGIGGKCSLTSQCVAGAFCANQKCLRTICTTNADCGGGTCGADRICAGVARISSVIGDTPTTDSRAPAGRWTTSTIFISGENFETDPSKLHVTLADAAGHVYDLLVGSATAGTIVAGLPSTVVPSAAMTLSVTGGTGTATRDVSLLQGPPGVTTAVAPLAYNASSQTLSLDTTGCAADQVLKFNGTTWGCALNAPAILYVSGYLASGTPPGYCNGNSCVFAYCPEHYVPIGGGCTPNQTTIGTSCPYVNGQCAGQQATTQVPPPTSGANHGWYCKVIGTEGVTAHAICLKTS